MSSQWVNHLLSNNMTGIDIIACCRCGRNGDCHPRNIGYSDSTRTIIWQHINNDVVLCNSPYTSCTSYNKRKKYNDESYRMLHILVPF